MISNQSLELKINPKEKEREKEPVKKIHKAPKPFKPIIRIPEGKRTTQKPLILKMTLSSEWCDIKDTSRHTVTEFAKNLLESGDYSG
nr:BPK_HP1_G0043970.mRNA.1.CDS.1 [Saccharomyces cerevisiae]